MDSRLIEKIKDFKFENVQLQKIQPVIYRQKNRSNERIGLISQQISTIEPLLTQKDSNGLVNVEYEALTVALLSSIQQLEKRVEDLEKANKKLTSKAKELK